jgi:ribosome-associated protein
MAKAPAPKADDTPRRKKPKLPKALAAAVAAAQDKQARDVVVLDLRAAGGFTDYFLICTGQNVRHIATIVDEVQKVLRDGLKERPAIAEGSKNSEWILLDYFDFVVHVFSPELRTFYALERLWGSADRYTFAEPAPPAR